jgi:hypothetical protein
VAWKYGGNDTNFVSWKKAKSSSGGTSYVTELAVAGLGAGAVGEWLGSLLSCEPQPDEEINRTIDGVIIRKNISPPRKLSDV